jgi:Winged helix-turn-helix
MKYRGRTEIVATMLEAANGRATKTKIMYNAFISYNHLKEYLSVLITLLLITYYTMLYVLFHFIIQEKLKLFRMFTEFQLTK